MTDRARIRVLFVDGGASHQETLSLPRELVERYDRLIDGLREDPAVLKQVYIDVDRLAAAWLVEEEG